MITLFFSVFFCTRLSLQTVLSLLQCQRKKNAFRICRLFCMLWNVTQYLKQTTLFSFLLYAIVKKFLLATSFYNQSAYSVNMSIIQLQYSSVLFLHSFYIRAIIFFVCLVHRNVGRQSNEVDTHIVAWFVFETVFAKHKAKFTSEQVIN